MINSKKAILNVSKLVETVKEKTYKRNTEERATGPDTDDNSYHPSKSIQDSYAPEANSEIAVFREVINQEGFVDTFEVISRGDYNDNVYIGQKFNRQELEDFLKDSGDAIRYVVENVSGHPIVSNVDTIKLQDDRLQKDGGSQRGVFESPFASVTRKTRLEKTGEEVKTDYDYSISTPNNQYQSAPSKQQSTQTTVNQTEQPSVTHNMIAEVKELTQKVNTLEKELEHNKKVFNNVFDFYNKNDKFNEIVTQDIPLLNDVMVSIHEEQEAEIKFWQKQFPNVNREMIEFNIKMGIFNEAYKKTLAK